MSMNYHEFLFRANYPCLWLSALWAFVGATVENDRFSGASLMIYFEPCNSLCMFFLHFNTK